MAVMLKHINEPIPLARLRSPNVPEAIERVILKATAKNPAERFGSVGEMNAGFQAALSHAQDPFNNPAPNIEVPPSSIAASIVVQESELPKKKPNRVRRVAIAAAALLLLVLACPVAASGVMEMLDGAANPAEGSGLSPKDMSGPQLTALAGTIEALSTELAGAGGDETQSLEQIQTAVMATLASDDDFLILGGIDGTPTPMLSATPGPSPTATKTFTPEPSPTASRTPTKTKTPTPGPSPTPSRTPTKTKTPTPGPSPTPSRTPTKTKTPTITPTSSPGPSPTATRTLVPSKTPTPFSSNTPFPSPTIDPTGTTTAMITPPPTETPWPTPPMDPCMYIWVEGYILGPPIVGIEIRNENPEKIEVAWVRMEWPPENHFHKKLDLAGAVIWDDGNPSPPTWATSLKGNRYIDGFSSKPLVGVFETAWPGIYEMEVGFTNGCVVYANP